MPLSLRSRRDRSASKVMAEELCSRVENGKETVEKENDAAKTLSRTKTSPAATPAKGRCFLMTSRTYTADFTEGK